MNSKTFFYFRYTSVKTQKHLEEKKSIPYDSRMFMNDFYIVFPEGDVQEIQGRIPLNTLVDINGNPLPLPLPTTRMIAFRVARISKKENKGGNETYHYLELMSAAELAEYARS